MSVHSVYSLDSGDLQKIAQGGVIEIEPGISIEIEPGARSAAFVMHAAQVPPEAAHDQKQRMLLGAIRDLLANTRTNYVPDLRAALDEFETLFDLLCPQ